MLIRPVLYVLKPVLPPFHVRKAEKYLGKKTVNDTSFTVREQEKKDKICF